jgi:hypothetical protein
MRQDKNLMDAIVAMLMESGFSQSDVIVLRNPDRGKIEQAISDIAQAFRQQSSREPDGSSAGFASASIIRANSSREFKFFPPKNTLFLLFFSGHGLNWDSIDYIVPRLPPDLTEVKDIKNGAISVSWLTERLESLAAASVIILDTHFPRFGPQIK